MATRETYPEGEDGFGALHPYMGAVRGGGIFISSKKLNHSGVSKLLELSKKQRHHYNQEKNYNPFK